MNLPDPARRAALLGLAAVWASAWAGAGCSRREPAPRFAYTLLDGSQRDSAALRGQVLMLHFWATTCAVCVKDMPQMVATQRRFAGRGLQTLAVAVAYDPPARVADFAERWALPFGVVIDNTGAIARSFGDVDATPTTVLIDRHGAQVRRWVGEPDFAALHAQIERLLAEA
jgi:peroxiredoxin